MPETMTISAEEYTQLKKKEKVADDLLLQLESSLNDLKTGKVKKVR
jgi:hypothetical protein